MCSAVTRNLHILFFILISKRKENLGTIIHFRDKETKILRG